MKSKNYLQICQYNDENPPQVMNTANWRDTYVSKRYDIKLIRNPFIWHITLCQRVIGSLSRPPDVLVCKS